MEIISLDIVDSTQTYLINAIKDEKIQLPIAVIADFQTMGIGSRENSWSAKRGNLFLSFGLPFGLLPSDLPLVSASLYFGYIMKETLASWEDGIWMKWPNDLYLENYKIGGVITQKIDDNLICGIGVNLHDTNDGYKGIEIKIAPCEVAKKFFFNLEFFPTWKQIFRKYQIEFDKNREHFVHIGNYQKSLSSAELCEDGSIILDGKKVYGLR